MHARGRFRGIAIGVALSIAAGTGAPALAQDAAEDEGGPAASERHTPREAVELFQRARGHYGAGRYDDAASDLESALVLDPGSPTLLYNLGRVYELSGQHDRAISIYQDYLRVVPPEDAAERERTEAAIRRLQGAREYVRPDEDVYSQALYVSQRGVADEAFWITLVAGAVVTLAGVALGIATMVTRERAEGFVVGRDGELDQRRAEFGDAATLAIATDVFGGIGAAALVTAGLLWVLREQTVELYPTGAPTALLVPDLDGGARVVVGGTF